MTARFSCRGGFMPPAFPVALTRSIGFSLCGPNPVGTAVCGRPLHHNRSLN